MKKVMRYIYGKLYARLLFFNFKYVKIYNKIFYRSKKCIRKDDKVIDNEKKKNTEAGPTADINAASDNEKAPAPSSFDEIFAPMAEEISKENAASDAPTVDDKAEASFAESTDASAPEEQTDSAPVEEGEKPEYEYEKIDLFSISATNSDDVGEFIINDEAPLFEEDDSTDDIILSPDELFKNLESDAEVPEEAEAQEPMREDLVDDNGQYRINELDSPIPEAEDGEEDEETKTPDEKDEKYDPEKPRRVDGRFDFIELFVFTLVAVMILTTFFFRHSIVEGESMEGTLTEGEHLIISDLFYKPERGDIIVCEDYETGLFKPIVKRIIAIGGDTVKVTYEKG